MGGRRSEMQDLLQAALLGLSICFPFTAGTLPPAFFLKFDRIISIAGYQQSRPGGKESNLEVILFNQLRFYEIWHS